jgi:hypothetical protein
MSNKLTGSTMTDTPTLFYLTEHEREDNNNNNLEQLVAFGFYQTYEPAPCRQAFLPCAAGHPTPGLNLTPQNPNLAQQIVVQY